MRIVDRIGGAFLGLLTYYALSLASALWVTQFGPDDYVWACLISVVTAVGLGIAIALRVEMALVIAGVMLILIVVGFIAGSAEDRWAAPLPLDIPSLFLHGARTPLVLLSFALVAASGVTRKLKDLPRGSSRKPTQIKAP